MHNERILYIVQYAHKHLSAADHIFSNRHLSLIRPPFRRPISDVIVGTRPKRTDEDNNNISPPSRYSMGRTVVCNLRGGCVTPVVVTVSHRRAGQETIRYYNNNNNNVSVRKNAEDKKKIRSRSLPVPLRNSLSPTGRSSVCVTGSERERMRKNLRRQPSPCFLKKIILLYILLLLFIVIVLYLFISIANINLYFTKSYYLACFINVVNYPTN